MIVIIITNDAYKKKVNCKTNMQLACLPDIIDIDAVKASIPDITVSTTYAHACMHVIYDVNCKSNRRRTITY